MITRSLLLALLAASSYAQTGLQPGFLAPCQHYCAVSRSAIYRGKHVSQGCSAAFWGSFELHSHDRRALTWISEVDPQNSNFTCIHMLRMPAFVKSRFRKRSGKPGWELGASRTFRFT